jgi:hypothetical protein
MHPHVEFIDVLGNSGLPRMGLLFREGIRRNRDASWKTWILSLLDQYLGMGYWWFRTFEHRCLNSDGSIYRQQIVRRTLSGYAIVWGHGVEYYDDGTKASEQLAYASAFLLGTTFRKCRYWLEDGTSVSQAVWMRTAFGPDIEGCYDPAWET